MYSQNSQTWPHQPAHTHTHTQCRMHTLTRTNSPSLPSPYALTIRRYCKAGHTGMLCAVCEDGWYRRGSASTCTICPDRQKSLLWTAGLSAGVFVAIVVFVLLDLRFGWSRAQGGSRLKLVVNCVQQLTVLTLFPVKWPDAVKDMTALFEGLSIDVSVVSPTCLGIPMDFYSKFAISAGLVFGGIVIPWVVAAFVALVMAWRTLAQRKRWQKRRIQRGGAAAAAAAAAAGGGGDGDGGVCRPRGFGRIFCTKWHRVLPTAARYSLIVMLFAHPAVSGQTFFFFSCLDIDDVMYVEERERGRERGGGKR